MNQAQRRVAKLGLNNVTFRCGDGSRGWPEEAPFDAILVTAGGPEVPEALRVQLAEGDPKTVMASAEVHEIYLGVEADA